MFLWTVPVYLDQTQSSRRAGPWLLQLEPPACAAVPRWHPHSRKRQLSQLDFLNFKVTVNNLEHELRDEGGSNCRLLHFLLPAAPWELFYWPIRLGKNPAGGDVLPSLNLPPGLGSPQPPAGCVYLAVITPVPSPRGDLSTSGLELWPYFPQWALEISGHVHPHFSNILTSSAASAANPAWLQSVHPTGLHPAGTELPFTDLLRNQRPFKSKPFIHSSWFGWGVNEPSARSWCRNRGASLCCTYSSNASAVPIPPYPVPGFAPEKTLPVAVARCKCQKMTLSVEVPSCLQHSTSSWSATY